MEQIGELTGLNMIRKKVELIIVPPYLNYREICAVLVNMHKKKEKRMKKLETENEKKEKKYLRNLKK